MSSVLGRSVLGRDGLAQDAGGIPAITGSGSLTATPHTISGTGTYVPPSPPAPTRTGSPRWPWPVRPGQLAQPPAPVFGSGQLAPVPHSLRGFGVSTGDDYEELVTIGVL